MGPEPQCSQESRPNIRTAQQPLGRDRDKSLMNFDLFRLLHAVTWIIGIVLVRPAIIKGHAKSRNEEMRNGK